MLEKIRRNRTTVTDTHLDITTGTFHAPCICFHLIISNSEHMLNASSVLGVLGFIGGLVQSSWHSVVATTLPFTLILQMRKP